MEAIQKYPAELLIMLFLTVTFLQSSLDKLLDWKGNRLFFKENFKNCFLKKSSFVGLIIVTIFELGSGMLGITGVLQLVFNNKKDIGLIAVVLSAVTLLLLLAGQRIAKNYEGAFTITGYFIIAVFGIYLLNK